MLHMGHTPALLIGVNILFIIKQEFLKKVQVSDRGSVIQNNSTNVADAGRAPAPSLGKTLYTEPSHLGVWTTLLPSITLAKELIEYLSGTRKYTHAATAQGRPLVGIKAPGNHVQNALADRVKDFMGVLLGPNAEVGTCRLLGRDLPMRGRGCQWGHLGSRGKRMT